MIQSIWGSSPRVWGQVYVFALTKIPLWIIPTRMGTSLCTVSPIPTAEDHPHAYGDKPRPVGRDIKAVGSSPRVWGQVIKIRPYRKSVRIIPTRMGTREHGLCNSAMRKDHPHAYGDKTKEIKENSGFAKSTA